MSKIGRNQTCPCGSGRKYKHCHGAFEAASASAHFRPLSKTIENAMRQATTQQMLRERQQGRGRGIISTKLGDRRFVAVGKNVFHSETWLTFYDFLFSYIKMKLGSEWGNGELAKDFAARHPVIQWYDAVAKAQAEHADATDKKPPGRNTG